MKTTAYALLILGSNVLAQDISNPQTTSSSTLTSTTIDQPTAALWSNYGLSQATQASPPSSTLPASTPLQASAPSSPGLPTAPTAPLSVLAPQQPSQPSSTTTPQEPLQPTPSAMPPSPIQVTTDSPSPMAQNSAHMLATRTLESLQNMTISLNNLVRTR
jgi:hypothetical protein